VNDKLVNYRSVYRLWTATALLPYSSFMHPLFEAWDSSHLLDFLTDESGQDIAEYAVLIGLIALTVVAAIAVLGGSISSVFDGIGSSLQQAGLP